MGLLGTQTSSSFVICISDWPQSSLQNNYLTRILCKKCFQILFNISKPIMSVRNVREVFVFGNLRNINLLHFWKIHLGLVTIVSAKMFLLVMLSSFHLFCSFNCFTFTLDKLHCWWKYFHFLFTILLPFVFTFTVYLWLLCNFVLTFTLSASFGPWYVIGVIKFLISFYGLTNCVSSFFRI